MSGIQNLQNYGQAQVLPQGGSDVDFVQMLNQQKQQGIANKRYDDRLKRENDKELYGILGDEFNPKNFNSLVQDKLRQATADLAMKIKSGQLQSYGDVFMEAKNKAGEIGVMSDKLNRIDSQLAATRNEYEKYDKRVNTPAIEFQARKNILDAIRTNKPIDENTNYFDQALNENPDIALNDNSDATFTDFKPFEKQTPSKDISKQIISGKTVEGKWKVDNYPAYFDVNMFNSDDFKEPQIKAKSEPSGFKDGKGNDVPMLSEDAYRRLAITPSNVIALNRRIKKQFPDINLNSEQAERLRRIEGLKDVVTQFTPQPDFERKEKYPAAVVNNFLGIGKNGKADGELNYNNVFDSMYQKAQSAKETYAKGGEDAITNAVNFEDLDQDEQKLVKSQITLSNSDIEGDNIKVILTPDDKLGIFKKDDGTRIGYISKTANVGANQPLGQKVKQKALDEAQKQEKTTSKGLPIFK